MSNAYGVLFTGARVLKTTHNRIKTLARKASMETNRDVSIRETYSALAELANKYPEELLSIVKSGKFEDGE